MPDRVAAKKFDIRVDTERERIDGEPPANGAQLKQVKEAKAQFAPGSASEKAVRAAANRGTGFDLAEGAAPEGPKMWKAPPKGVEIIPNTTGRGTWIEKWLSPSSGKWVHNYTVEEMRRRAGEKFVENRLFGDKLPSIRDQVARDMDTEGEPLVLASIVRLIDRSYIRVGNEDSVGGGVYGATTLLNQHVTIKGNEIKLDFLGKKRVPQNHVFRDAELAAILKKFKAQTKPGAALFQLHGERVTAEQVNGYLEPFGVTAKNFRTYHATRLAREYLLEHLDASPADRPKIVAAMFEHNAPLLGHSPAVDRDSYVDPMVVKSFLEGTLR